MILIKPSILIEHISNEGKVLETLERYGRVCYKSEEKITQGSAEKFIKMITERGHETILEHEKVTVRFIVDRGVTHEIVRHRLASYSQESTRYCNYKGGLGVIMVPWEDFSAFKDEYILDDTKPLDFQNIKKMETIDIWLHKMMIDEWFYQTLIEKGWTPQKARAVLPNSLKTEIVMTANLREWRWFFLKRASKYAHPQMQEVARPLLAEFQKRIPIIYCGINEDES